MINFSVLFSGRAQPTIYDLLPIDFISKAGTNDIDRDKIDKQIEFELSAPQRNYGDDYVEYDRSVYIQSEDTNAEFDLLLLELDNEIDENEISETNETTEDTEIHELDNIDLEIFQDPELIIKWLKKLN